MAHGRQGDDGRLYCAPPHPQSQADETAAPQEDGAKAALLELGIEDFDVQQRRFRDGHSFRPYAQQSTQSRYENP